MSSASRTGGRSIKFLVYGLIGLQALFLFLVIGFSSGTDFWRARGAAADQAAVNANRAAGAIGKAVERTGDLLVSEAGLPGYAAVFDDPSGCTVTSGGADVFARSDFHVLRGDGTVACTSTRPAGGLPGPGYAGSPWLDELRSGEALVAGPLTDPIGKHPSLIVAAPLGDVPGALVLSLDVASLGLGLGELAHGAPVPAYVVLNEDRSQVIARTTGTGDTNAVAGTRFVTPVAKGTKAIGIDGVEGIFAEASVEGLGWHVIAGISTSDVDAQGGAQLRDRLLLAGLLLLIVLAVGWIINRRIGDPIRALDAAVEDATRGDLSTEVPSEGPAELARLAERFNGMIAMRAQAESALVDAYQKERKAGDRLRELNDLKNAFLLAISHELRTPLTSVVGYAALLEEDPARLGPEVITECASAIGVSARRLDKLLADLLDIERLQRGVVEARCRPTDMRELVRRVLEHIEADGRVTFAVPKGTEVDVDPALVERLVENLVLNALKHTPSDTKVHVRSELWPKELVLIVEDGGPGVPDELKAVIFEPFRHGVRPEHTPGTGIGLSLVSEFAKVHGGRAWVEDRDGGGASFRVALPLAAGANGRRGNGVRARSAARGAKTNGNGSRTKAKVQGNGSGSRPPRARASRR